MFTLQPIIIPRPKISDQTSNELTQMFAEQINLGELMFVILQVEFFTHEEDHLIVRDACLDNIVKRVSPKQQVRNIQHYLDQGFSQVESELFFMNNYQTTTGQTYLDQDQLNTLCNSYHGAPHRLMVRQFDHALNRGRPFFKEWVERLYIEVQQGIMRMPQIVDRLHIARQHGCYLNPHVKENVDGSIMITLQNV